MTEFIWQDSKAFARWAIEWLHHLTVTLWSWRRSPAPLLMLQEALVLESAHGGHSLQTVHAVPDQTASL